ncbi:pre-mrna-splicing factor syf2 [Lasallia pustulata]|uniref:Pre-mRNA-splicing factor SYF2 n=1 Tax=Lasallia pustulata TaxID=136370 RepID=A0A1W5DE15_9LECA|nr:pre-mrna-splicing factor syf2 [Lasallia pustulata]
MPPSKRRRVSESSEAPMEEADHGATANDESTVTPIQAAAQVESKPDETTSTKVSESASDTADKNRERQDRFKALQARAKKSAERNLKEAAAESHRLATDPTLLSSLSRKQAFASHKLLKADTAAAGEDFERKRAWDWTIEESEKWDKRMGKKERHREDVAFQDYSQDSRKVYKRQLRDMKPDVEAYEKCKMEAVQKAAVSGALEIVETDDGELVAVDRNGTFYSTMDSTDFVENRPDRAAVERLVTDLRKAEESRLRKRRDRGKGEEEGDVTYINDKNKQFNQKLARFYNKYTAEIRDSFERGTMI